MSSLLVAEDQFSLPRWQDLSISRQTVYDNTFTKIPSMGWMFMPLVQVSFMSLIFLKATVTQIECLFYS
jgi:hypothetical protein